MRLTVIGAGYVGLVAGACFARLGHEVWCVESDPGRLDQLRRGQVPFHEPALAELMRAPAGDGQLQFADRPAAPADVVFIAVGTPIDGHGGLSVDPLERLIDGLPPSVIVLKTTVPVGTTARLATRHPHHVLAANPEFLREGSAVSDFQHPARIIVGTDSALARELLGSLYAPLGAPVLFMDSRSAELTKLAANAMLATRVSFMNELSHLASATGANLARVQDGLGSDPRIGPHYLSAGMGWGGSCLPKDLGALRELGREHGQPTALLDAVHSVNERQKLTLIEQARTHLGTLQGRRVGVWGLAFKPNTDDVRGAPALEMVRALRSAGAQVRVFDPVAMPSARRELGEHVEWATDAYDALTGADALFVATEWSEFAAADPTRMKALMRGHFILDGRNCLPRESIEAAGLTLIRIGAHS